MDRFYLCALFLLLTISRVQLIPTPRNFHGKCEIRINEIFLSSARQSYTEISKICKIGKEFDSNTRLTGFALIVIETRGNELYCAHAVKLNEKLLDETLDPTVTPVSSSIQNAVERGASRALHTNRGMDVLHSRARIPSFMQQPSTQGNMGVVEREKRETSNYKLQTNSKLFYVIDTPGLVLFNNGIAVVALLKLDYIQMKRQLPCRVNSKIEKSDLDLIKLYTHDQLILQASIGVDKAELVQDIIPQGVSLEEIQLHLYHMAGQQLVSFSKCDNVITSTQASRFKIAPLTKRLPNMCDTNLNFINNPSFHFPYKFKGSAFEVQSQKLILNLVKSLPYFTQDPEFIKKRPKAQAAGLLNIGETSIRIIEKRLKNDKLYKPGVKRKITSKIQKDMMKPENKELLYKTVTSFYGKNIIPTLPLIYEEFLRQIRTQSLKELEAQKANGSNASTDDIFTCSQQTFSKILKAEGYKYGRLNNRDSVLFDPKRIAWRRRYLRRLRENRETKERELVFLDETWHDPHSRLKCGWKKCKPTMLERKELAPAKSKISRGGRLIILAAGGKFGFVKESIFVKKVSKTESAGDYHQNIDQTGFQNWFIDLMKHWDKISNKKMLIIMDNAPYHTSHSAPISSARKAEIITWLKTQKEEGFDVPNGYETMLLIELKQVVKKLKEETPRFKIDDMARNAGHEILRLPPYNCELNPIEFVWKDIKHQLLRENREQDINLQLIRAKSAMLAYTSEQWTRHVEHIERLEDSYWDGDQVFDNAVGQSPEIQAELDNLAETQNDEAEECNLDIDGDEELEESETEADNEQSTNAPVVESDVI